MAADVEIIAQLATEVSELRQQLGVLRATTTAQGNALRAILTFARSVGHVSSALPRLVAEELELQDEQALSEAIQFDALVDGIDNSGIGMLNG